MTGNESWLKELLRTVVDRLEKIEERLANVENCVAGHKVRLSLWGVIGGALPLVAYLVYLWASHPSAQAAQ